MKSRIEVNPETGLKSLIVFYNSESDDFNEAINQALDFHNIREGKISVIALPENSTCQHLMGFADEHTIN